MWRNSPTLNAFRPFGTLCLLVVILTLSACSGLTRSDKPPVKTWWLVPYVEAAPIIRTEKTKLLETSVTVVPGLDTNRILTLSGDAVLNRYSGARWAEHLPELLGSLTTRTLESSGHFEVVSARVSGERETCNLQLEIQEFFANLGPVGQTTGVSIVARGRFDCDAEASVLIRLSASVPVREQRMSAIIAAFQQAVDVIMKDLLETLAGEG